VHKKGKLCGLLGNPGEPTLVVEVKRFVFIISCMAIIMAIVFFVIGIATGVPPLFAFINGFVVVLIANIPQVRNRVHEFTLQLQNSNYSAIRVCPQLSRLACLSLATVWQRRTCSSSV
jgi:hypothetical protein